MFKRELKVNFKNFMIWTLILIILFLAVFLIYPSIISGDNMKALNDMMKMFPEDLLKAFNMDISSIDSAFGWIKTEGFVFVLLIAGIYSGILGSSILLKEENDKTIEYLNSVPVKRTQIVINKVVVGLLYIALMVMILGIFNYAGLTFSGEFDAKSYWLLSITPIFSSVVIFALCLFLSTFAHKTKNTIGISLGIVFAGYFLNVVSELSEETEFLRYLSVFTLADIRNVILDVKINPYMVLAAVGLSAAFIGGALLRYHRKELV